MKRGKKSRYKYNRRVYFNFTVPIFVTLCTCLGTSKHRISKKTVSQYKIPTQHGYIGGIWQVPSLYHSVLALTNKVTRYGRTVDDTNYSTAVRFDTDSFPVKIDNCCTQTMSGFKADFIPETLVAIQGKHVIGFANTKTMITHKGTITWQIADDEGATHDISIPNSYYVPGCDIRLLSPQHWSQEANDNLPASDGTWCATYRDRVVLQWSQLRYKKTLKIDPRHGNVATMWTIGGSTKYKTLCKIVQDAAIIYDAAVDTTSPPLDKDTEIYEPTGVWDDIKSLRQEGEGVLAVSGQDVMECSSNSTVELLEWHYGLDICQCLGYRC
jgi:hypothetical protein